MADDNTTNLDLNLMPGSVPALEDDTINLDDEWSDDSADMIREEVRRTVRRRWRWLNIGSHLETTNVSMDVSRSVGDGSSRLQTGEGSVAAEERVADVEKMFVVDDEKVEGENDDDDKGSFYDCNICFELAKDPVITCCGHLYCWPCIYRWLHIHADACECPVCKGEVTMKTVTPIYGRGDNKRVPEEGLTVKIPSRPIAKRVESSTFSIPVEEMIRRLVSRFDLTRDFSATQDMENTMNLPDRNPSHLLNRIMTTRAMRREQFLAPLENVVDLTDIPDAPGNIGLQLCDHWARRAARNRYIDTSSHFPPSMSASERVIEAYMRSHPVVERRPEQSPPVDDTDLFSSIFAGMHSGSRTVDTAIEIDSVVSLPVSSSRRRNDSSRASDVDNGESRLPRRRRLN